MKIVINKCYGGFSLSAAAVKRMAELQGKECYFFDFKDKPITFGEASGTFMWLAYSAPVRSNDVHLENSPGDRADPFLVQVVEELGEESFGQCAELEVVEIPDDVDWEIQEYDGFESIHEKHRSW